ncbi:MAG TPA: 50S ribosomal protein L21 [Planctomycetota bacterium]|nr:50S ribosomal protein L21 [Planctomycetota bacterium]
MYAIIRDGSRQLRVEKGGTFQFDRKAGKAGTIEFTEVLVLHDGEKVKVGAPLLKGAKVVGEVVKETLTKKIRVTKYKRREGYHKTRGHRQKHTLIKITDIVG